ncbi:MAG: hypothetical protein ACYDH5_14005 [Acidimicrobiales bacterium]
MTAGGPAALAPTDRMGPTAAARHATSAGDVLAPPVVAAAGEASTDGYGPVNDVIVTVASYGRRLPEPAQVRYAERVPSPGSLSRLRTKVAKEGSAGSRPVSALPRSSPSPRRTGNRLEGDGMPPVP